MNKIINKKNKSVTNNYTDIQIWHMVCCLTFLRGMKATRSDGPKVRVLYEELCSAKVVIINAISPKLKFVKQFKLLLHVLL